MIKAFEAKAGPDEKGMRRWEVGVLAAVLGPLVLAAIALLLFYVQTLVVVVLADGMRVPRAVEWRAWQRLWFCPCNWSGRYLFQRVVIWCMSGVWVQVD